MTEQPPDYVIKPTVSTVHKGILNFLPGWFPIPQVQQDTFIKWGQNIANKDALAAGEVPVSGTGVTGAVAMSAIGIAPASAVAVSPTNMLVSQNFSSADTVAQDSNWSWDGSDGNITLGCARCECDGAQSDLVSNEIPVIVGENIEVACQVKWENLDYTDTDPIILGVERYRQGRDPDTGGVTYLDLGGVDVASIGASPAADGGWGTDGDLAGTYVVEAGVDLLRTRFRPAPTITSGVVKWDEAVFLKLDLIDDAAVPGVGTTVDDIVVNLYGTEGDSFTHNDAAVALANTSAAITAINARLSASEAEASSGAIAGDDFSWSGEVTANANWGGDYTLATTKGNYTADGNDAVWIPTGLTPAQIDQQCKFIWEGTGSTSSTDYQKVQLLLSSAPVTGPKATFKSYIRILGRIASGFSSYDRATIGSDGTYVIDYWNGSTFTTMDSGTCSVPGLGSLVSFYCGDKNATATRHFKLTANTTTIADFDEVGTGSPLGGSNRGWGWGARAIGGFWLNIIVGATGQGRPPKINQWLGYDQ